MGKKTIVSARKKLPHLQYKQYQTAAAGPWQLTSNSPFAPKQLGVKSALVEKYERFLSDFYPIQEK